MAAKLLPLPVLRGKLLSELPPGRQRFVAAYLKTGDAEQAYLAAGYSTNKVGNFRTKANKILFELDDVIRGELIKRVLGTGTAVRALNVLESLATDTDIPAPTRLAAASQILKRGGWDREAHQEDMNEREVNVQRLSDDQLDAQIEAVKRRISRLAPETVAPVVEPEPDVLDVEFEVIGE